MNALRLLRKWFSDGRTKLSRSVFIKPFNGLPSPREGCDGFARAICMGKGEGGGKRISTIAVSTI
jgi:hypothetical protein